jgi:vancomycin resistance protein YoaR
MINKYLLRCLFLIVSFLVLSEGVSANLFPFDSEEYHQALLRKKIILKVSPLTPNLTFEIKMTDFPHWIKKYSKYYYQNWEVLLPVNPDQQTQTQINEVFAKKEIYGIDRAEIALYLQENITHQVHRDRQDVIINKNEQDQIVFEGVGFDGRTIDIAKTVILIKYALENEAVPEIIIPFLYDKAKITILNPELQQLGFGEIIAVGESNFNGSTWSRIHNLTIGSSKLSGKIIMPEEEYSVGANLGAVNASTGYKQELVIKGSRTVPEYGGGLCQVSSTLYRGALLAGLPVTERLNHSYAVSYYSPYGTDATIYPPTVDLKFVNDTGHPILIQNYVDVDNRQLYFIFYGQNDGRHTELYGPYLSNWHNAPGTKVEYTSELAPGEKKFFGHAVSGFDSHWYRYVTSSSGAELISETIFSRYQARPTYYAIGTAISGDPEILDRL